MKFPIMLKQTFIRSMGVLLYVGFVAIIMSRGGRIFDGKSSFLIPVFMLLLFVVSATVTGYLVLAEPIILYLSGEKKKSILFLFSVLGWLLLYLLVILLYFVLV